MCILIYNFKLCFQPGEGAQEQEGEEREGPGEAPVQARQTHGDPLWAEHEVNNSFYNLFTRPFLFITKTSFHCVSETNGTGISMQKHKFFHLYYPSYDGVSMQLMSQYMTSLHVPYER